MLKRNGNLVVLVVLLSIAVLADIVEGKVIVVFRYDDYSTLSNTDLEARLFATFAEKRFPLAVGIIPYACPDFS